MRFCGNNAKQCARVANCGAVIQLAIEYHGQADNAEHIQISRLLQIRSKRCFCTRDQGVLKKQVTARCTAETKLGKYQHAHAVLLVSLACSLSKHVRIVCAVSQSDLGSSCRNLHKSVFHRNLRNDILEYIIACKRKNCNN